MPSTEKKPNGSEQEIARESGVRTIAKLSQLIDDELDEITSVEPWRQRQLGKHRR